MSNPAEQPKLLGFAGHRMLPNTEALRETIRHEVVTMKDLLGKRMIVISGLAARADLIFLKACVELRIPAIVILPFPEERFAGCFEDAEEWVMAQQLVGVALARYIAPSMREAPEAYQIVSRLLLEYADAFLFVWNGDTQNSAGSTGEAMVEAQDLGIPSRVIDTRSLTSKWETPPDPDRRARHGFHSRADLLDFLDARFAASK